MACCFLQERLGELVLHWGSQEGRGAWVVCERGLRGGNLEGAWYFCWRYWFR